MATPTNKYYTKILEIPVDYKINHNAPLFNEKVRKKSTIMEETEEEGRNMILDTNNVTIYTLCQFPVTTSTQE